jgi:hypothetical protein
MPETNQPLTEDERRELEEAQNAEAAAGASEPPPSAVDELERLKETIPPGTAGGVAVATEATPVERYPSEPELKPQASPVVPPSAAEAAQAAAGKWITLHVWCPTCERGSCLWYRSGRLPVGVTLERLGVACDEHQGHKGAVIRHKGHVLRASDLEGTTLIGKDVELVPMATKFDGPPKFGG